MNNVILMVSDESTDAKIYPMMLREKGSQYSFKHFLTHEAAEEYLRSTTDSVVGALVQYYLTGGACATQPFMEYLLSRVPASYLTYVVPHEDMKAALANNPFIDALCKPIRKDQMLQLSFLNKEEHEAPTKEKVA